MVFKMNLTSFFVSTLISAISISPNLITANLIPANSISSNLPLFLDRLITDGNYKTVLFIYDDTDAIIKDTNFLPQLSDLSFGKYAMCVMREDYSNFGSKAWRIFSPYREHSGLLQILTLNYSEGQMSRLPQLLNRYNEQQNKQNVVLLIPMPPDNQRNDIWHHFEKRSSAAARRINLSVIFYRKEMSMMMAKTPRKSIEIFALNYGEEFRGRSKVDVKNSVCNVQLNESNFHDNIFESITKKMNLVIETTTAAFEPITVQRGNVSLINLMNADHYLSNFIASNLRAKHVLIQQRLRQEEVRNYFVQSQSYEYIVSKEKLYAELYNEQPLHHLRFVSRLTQCDS